MPPFWKKTQNLQKRAEWLASQTFVVLAIQVPKDNQKTPQSAEQFFAALHGIFRNDPVTQEHISFELVAKKDSIVFYVFTPIHLREFIEGQLYAQYPDLNISQISDYTKQADLEGKHVAVTKIQLTKEDVYPIKTFTGSDLDPLAGITAVLSGLEEGEQVWLQVLVRPVGDDWQNKGVKYVQDLRSGKDSLALSWDFASKFARFSWRVVREMIQPGSGVGETKTSSEPPKLSAPQEAALKGIESKVTKLGFETIFRLVSISSEVQIAKSRLQSVLAAFKQYNTTNLNGFMGGEIKIDDYPSWEQYVVREFEEKGNILNIEELASVYHFPANTVETSAISWAGSKKGEAPFNLPLKELVTPENLTVIGKTDFRNSSKEFGIKLDDRMRHVYVIGKSGTGKSTLLENMIIDDILEGRGVVLVDPHGELADKVVDSIPEERIRDVVVLDPSDREYPIAFNLLEQVGDDYKGMVASGFVGIFKKIFGNSWGPRLEYILRNTVLALLDSENSTMLGIPRMLTEQAFREQVVAHIKDSVIRDFWVNEFAGMDQKQRSEAIAPILNKVGQFLSTSTIRNIVGQPKSTIDIRQIMDERKILVVNLSKGKIGEDNMALLGAMIITKVQLAAMSRANVAFSERPPCFLYVDEFQNFATDSFATILSEARKYNLGLTIAHQYIAQMSEEVRDAVIGNVGTIICFRVGAPDAEVLVKEFAPIFDSGDLVNLEKARVYIKLLIDGIAAPAFSAQTLPPKQIPNSFRGEVIHYSRSNYTRQRDEVEATIDETAGYRRKREGEEAVRQAQEILAQGTSIAIQPAQANGGASPKVDQNNHYMPPNAKPELPKVETGGAPVAPPVKPLEVLENTPAHIQAEQGSAVEYNKEPKQDKPLKVMDGWVYKEVSQKGGQKWYIGEPEEEVRARLEEKKRIRETDDNNEQINPVSEAAPSPESQSKDYLEENHLDTPEISQPDSPAFLSPAEQMANSTDIPLTDSQAREGVKEDNKSEQEFKLEEGDSLTL